MKSMTLLIAWIVGSTACTSAVDLETSEEGATANLLTNEPCDYITCGENTSTISNRFVDQVFFNHEANARGQVFIDWTLDGKKITPALDAQIPLIAAPGGPTLPQVLYVLKGVIDGKLSWGPALDGSTMRLFDKGWLMTLRFTQGRTVTLPNHVTTWVYRIDVWPGVWPGQQPLCDLFDDTNSDLARYALLGTRELVNVKQKVVTEQDPAAGNLTLGCPSTAVGKLLSLGAMRTTAAAGEEPTAAEMTATLRALTLSPTGGSTYTEPGVGVMFSVRRTGVNNHGELYSGGREGYWNETGAICFEHLRIHDEAERWKLWTETQVPACNQIDLHSASILVVTDLYTSWFPSGYPPSPPPAISQ